MKTKLNKQRSHTAHWRRIITECCTLNSENQSRRQKENKWSCVKASRLQIQGGQQGSERTQWTEREATEKGVKGEQQSHVPALLYLLWSLIKRAKHCGRQEEKRSFTLITIKNKTTKDELQIKRPTDEQTHMHMDTDTLIWIHLFCQSVYSCGTDTDETSKTHQLSWEINSCWLRSHLTS